MSDHALELIEKEMREKTGRLDLAFREITQIPEKIKELVHLQSLNLSSNQITDIRFLENLSNLETLDLSSNQLSDIGFLENLSNLQSLYLGSNQLTDIGFLKNLSNLQTLDLSSNQLSDIGFLKNLSNLQTLVLDSNHLSNIRFLENLSNLQNLDLRSNHLSDIRFLENLSNLQNLYLSSNQITDITSLLPLIKLGKMKVDLERYNFEGKIKLSNNPITEPPLEIVKQGNPAILKYFEELETQGTTELYEAKMLIIGEGGAGKTSLAEKLMDKSNPLPAEEATTKGIDIKEYHFTTTAGKDFRINIWDFGGQEIYHATHQFFLTKRSLYVLVDDTRKDDKTRSDAAFNYWLETVELLGGGSPIVIVQNEKGDRSKALDMKSIQSRFENVKGSYATNLLDCRGLDKTKTALEHFIQELPIVGQKLPKQWVEIRNALEAKERDGTHYLSLKDYYAVCAQHKIPEADRALLLSQYLHDLGVFLHFQEDDLLKKIIILHNEWATDAVYKVLDCESVKTAKGRFTREDLKTIWGDDDCQEKYQDMHGELLALMRNFELCFELESEKNTFLAPQLFPEERPEYDWDETDNLILRYQYGFMPKGLLSRLIVRMHLFVKDLEKAWKNGVVLQKGNTQAEVVNLYAEKEIRIRVKGADSKSFLDNIIYEFEKLHQDYEGIKVDKKIPCSCTVCLLADWKVKYYFKYEVLKKAYANNVQEMQCQESFQSINVHRLINDTLMAKNMEQWKMERKEYIQLKQSHTGAGDNVGGNKITNVTNNYHSDEATPSVSIFEKNPVRSPIDKAEVRKLITKDELGEVFDILLESTEDVGLQNDINLLKKRWRDNNKEKRRGVISDVVFGLVRNRVSGDLLDWTGEW